MWSWGQTYVAWNEPAIKPLGEAVSNSRVGRLGHYDGVTRTRSSPPATRRLADAAVAPLGAERVAELESHRAGCASTVRRDVLPYAESG